MKPPEPDGKPETAADEYFRQLRSELTPILAQRAKDLPALGDDPLERMLEVATAAAINPGSDSDRQKALSILALVQQSIEIIDSGRRFAPLHMLVVSLQLALQGLDEGRVEALVQPQPKPTDEEDRQRRGTLPRKTPQMQEALMTALMVHVMTTRRTKDNRPVGRDLAAKELAQLSELHTRQFLNAYSRRTYPRRRDCDTLHVYPAITSDEEFARALVVLRQGLLS